jgi:hypothetical protein
MWLNSAEKNYYFLCNGTERKAAFQILLLLRIIHTVHLNAWLHGLRRCAKGL